MVAGDTVTFAVPTATEVGTYVVSAVSENSNYVVADNANTCSFTIAMPEIKLTGAENDQLTWYLQGTTIFVSGVTAGKTITVSVAAKLAEGQQSASAEVSCGQTDGSVVMGGITYTVNAASMVKSVNEISFADGTTEVGVLPENASESLKAAATAENNGVIGLNASLAAEAENLVKNALGETEAPANGVVVTTYGYIDVVEYVPEKSYTVKITPRFAINKKDGAELAAGMIQNDWLSAPVEVKLTVPSEINLDLAKTYIRQTRADGSSKYIKPNRIEGQTVSFKADELCTFEIVNDSRTARITFPVNDGMQTIVYGPEDIGAALPTVTPPNGKIFKGWMVGKKTYTSVTEEMLNTFVGMTDTVQAEPVFQDRNQGGEVTPSGSGSSSSTYPVEASNKEYGTITVSPKNASAGDTVTVTVKPDSGYVLGSLTVTDSKGDELTLTDLGDGRYRFTMPARRVEVKASFVKTVEVSPFADVMIDAYYYEAVKWAVKNGITTGVGNDLFAPGQPCTRAQIVTFLWRAAGSPEPKGTAAAMSDVLSGSYYEKAVAWAIENGVTTGTGEGKFSPDATCTRAQAVTFLARALNAKTASAAEFSDVPTDSYYAEAVAWASANGVTEGVGSGLFAPDSDCTRGQIVTFLYRAYNK